jgi:hypothetical protein
MRIGSTLTIPAEPRQVFERFLDPDTMQACIPGCTELQRLDDTHYRGLLVNEVAHVRFNASFAAEITEIQSPRLVRAVLTGEDRKLGSSLKINATLEVVPDGDQSKVTYGMDLALWGKLGRLGEPIVRRRSVEVEQQFSAAFADAVLGRTPAPAPVPARPKFAAKPAGAPAVSGSGPAAGVATGSTATAVAATASSKTDAAVRSGRVDDPHFWRNIAADILEHLAWKLR